MVVPQPKAGGSFATVTYRSLQAPVAVEHIQANMGLDIGGTLIGMHLKEVAVPLRISVKRIGKANLLCAIHDRNISVVRVQNMNDANLLLINGQSLLQL